MRSARGALVGRCIVVTRPAAQAAELAGAIEREGGEAMRFPAIEIVDAEDPRAVHAILGRLEEFEFAVFVSPSAVQRGLAMLRERRERWPARVRVVALGEGSRRELVRQGIGQVLAPAAGSDSEALLAMPELQAVAGRRVVILRGQGGRELLGETLAARGALVEYAECYRRRRPQHDAAPLLDAWARNALDAVTISSGEGLANLIAMIGTAGQAHLRVTPVFVPHQRIALAATQLGLERVHVAGPGDAEVAAALVAYFRGAK